MEHSAQVRRMGLRVGQLRRAAGSGEDAVLSAVENRSACPGSILFSYPSLGTEACPYRPCKTKACGGLRCCIATRDSIWGSPTIIDPEELAIE